MDEWLKDQTPLGKCLILTLLIVVGTYKALEELWLGWRHKL